MLTIRPYQQTAITNVLADWQDGFRRLLLMAATGTGKTVIFLAVISEILRRKPAARILVLAHRRELIYQPLERAQQFFTGLSFRMGVVMADKDDVASQVIVATIQSLAVGNRLERILQNGPIEYVVIDECFPAGTLVDGKPIETIQVGDKVTAYSEIDWYLHSGLVSRVFKREAPLHLIRITIGERQIVCTFNHPILSQSGWIPAGEINENDRIYVCGSNPEMQPMWKGVPSSQPGSALQLPKKGRGMLLGGMQENEVIGNDGADQSEIRQPTDERAKSDDAARVAGENAGDDQGKIQRRIPGEEAREWLFDGSADDAGRRPEVGRGSSYQYRAQAEGRERVSDVLQSGYREPQVENCNRGGREESQSAGQEGGRCQENRVPTLARVDRVEVLERGSDGEFERMCPDGYVYNLEVADYHTYTANGIVVHNCHHATAETYLSVLKALDNPFVLGCTATPKRSDKLPLGDVFQKVSYRISIQDAIGQGALVPFTPLGFVLPANASKIKETQDGWEDEPMGELLSTPNILEIVFEKWKEFSSNRQTIGFTASVAQAHTTAEFFSRQGISSAAVDGTTPKAERDRILRQYQAGEIQVVFNCMVLTEGFDAPETAAVMMISPTRSDLIYVQRLGRGLRPAKAKSDCLVLDFAPMGVRDVVMAGDVLDGVPKRVKVQVEQAQEAGVLMFNFQVTANGIQAIDPHEITAVVLDYLQHNRLAWTFDGALATASLGEDAIVAILPPERERLDRADNLRRGGRWDDNLARVADWIGKYRVYKVEKRYLDKKPEKGSPDKGRYTWIASCLGAWPSMPEAKTAAENLSREYGEDVLNKKNSFWRKRPMTQSQANYLRRLGAYRPGLTAGQAAQHINHTLARQVIYRTEQIKQKQLVSGQPGLAGV